MINEERVEIELKIQIYDKINTVHLILSEKSWLNINNE
jgi:hypothetical protein